MNKAQMEAEASLVGTVVFLMSNQGSKSEAVLPYLYVTQEKIVRTLFKGDNPFENASLRLYDGRRVKVFGTQKPNGTFLVERIELDGNTASENQSCDFSAKAN